jgi:hypothetical protein
MPRKPYHQIVKRRVAALRVDDSVMLGPDAPTAIVVGQTFEHVYTSIRDQGDSPIVRAFVACDLELNNPFHWANLLEVFCNLHFSPRKQVIKIRTKEFVAQLQRDRALVAQRFPNAKTQMDQAKRLRQEFKERYGSYHPNSLRRLFKSNRSRKIKARGGAR